MIPSVGRVVHYVARGSADGVYPKVCRAAIITEVGPDQNTGYEGRVSLCVLNPTGLFFHEDCEYSEHGEFNGAPSLVPGTWHWPERVE